MIVLTKDHEFTDFLEKVRREWSSVTDESPQISDKIWKKYCASKTRGQFLDFEAIKEMYSENDSTNSKS